MRTMNNSGEELEKVLELLRIEQEEDRKQYEEHVLNSPLKDRRDAGLTWYPLVVCESYYGVGERLILELERTSNLDTPHQFQSGKVASLFCNQSTKSKENSCISGIISSARPNNIRLTLFVDELPEWIDDGKLGLDLLFDETSYKEMEHALQFVKKARNCRLADLREVLLGYKKATFSEGVSISVSNLLNTSQTNAIRNIASAKDVAIIHGPPGTGKTTTLVASIIETLKEEEQVLVCAPSNTAVDLLTEKIAEKGISVLRIGNPARVTDTILNHTLDVQITKHRDYKLIKELKRSSIEYKNMALKYKRNFGKEEREQRKQILNEARKLQFEADRIEKFIIDSILKESKVIACTLVGSSSYILKGRTYKTVFIDEAAQALEPATWIPIMRSERVVFAGDHCQLPPTVKSSEASKGGLIKTLFEKCIARQEVAVMLDTQYRMNEKIMGFSNLEFYNSGLIAHESVRSSLLGEGDVLEMPLEFIDTAGCGFEESSETGSTSLVNYDEAKLLYRHFEVLKKLIGSEVSVGFISPYKAQVNLLKELKEKDEGLNSLGKMLTINTVDGFQGQERDVIYISLVRSNDRGEIGFLADTRRMNVAMTRARKKLVLIGDSATLSNNAFYKRFLEYADEQGAYRSAWEMPE